MKEWLHNSLCQLVHSDILQERIKFDAIWHIWGTRWLETPNMEVMSRSGVIGCHYTVCPWWLGTFLGKSWEVSHPSLRNCWWPWLPWAMASCKVSSGNNFSAKRYRLRPQNPDVSHGELLEEGSSAGKEISMKCLGLDILDLEIRADYDSWSPQPGRSWRIRVTPGGDVNLTTGGMTTMVQQQLTLWTPDLALTGFENAWHGRRSTAKRRWPAVGATTKPWVLPEHAHVDPDRFVVLHEFDVSYEYVWIATRYCAAQQCSNCMSTYLLKHNGKTSSFHTGKGCNKSFSM